jgi:hypothetical protein
MLEPATTDAFTFSHLPFFVACLLLKGISVGERLEESLHQMLRNVLDKLIADKHTNGLFYDGSFQLTMIR